MGTPEFAVPCLKRIIEDGHEVVLVVTQNDKPKGRGYVLTPPPVKEYALTQGVEVFQPQKLKNNKEAWQRMAACQPDLAVVVAYGKILPREVLKIPKLGCINVHASLLPKYRGAAPIQWSVLNGEKQTGVTTMQMDEGLDTGDMLLQSAVEITPSMTAGELHDVLSLTGAELLSKTLTALINGTLQPQKQEDALSCYAPMLSREMSALDWHKPADTLHNQVRGLNPWPSALTTLEGKTLKIHKTVLGGETDAAPGTVVSVQPLTIACGDNKTLEIHEVQYEGARRMTAADFLRGHAIPVGTILPC